MTNSGGPAQPITDSPGAVQQGGAAVPAVLVTNAPIAGGPAQPVYIVTSGPVQGGAPIPVAYAPVGTPVAGGSALPIYLIGSTADPQLGPATVAALNTTVTNDLSPDGFTWAAVHGACVVDSFGKVIIYAQRYNANTRQCYFVFSNDSGATWNDNTGIVGGEGFLTRGDIVYDAANDCLHGLIVTTNPSDGGIIYRRYTIARDGSNNITSIARVVGVSVVLDDASADNGNGLEFPTIRMVGAATLLAAWTVRSALGGEIRTCRCDISGDINAGGTAANWVNIGINSVSLLVDAVAAVASYTIPFTQALANALTYFSFLQLASGDLRWVYHNGPTPGTWFTRRSVLSAAVTWNSFSTQATVTNVQRAGTDTGYSLKNQLISQLTEASGVTFVGLATWKSDADGDTWGVYAIAADDSLSTSVDVYSAGGAHSYAPTGDCAYDATAARLVVTYEETTTQDGYIGLLDTSLATTQAFAAFETATDIDIPVIAQTRVDDSVLIIWRVAGSPPQDGESARLAWT